MLNLTVAQLALTGAACAFNLGLVSLAVLVRLADRPDRPLIALRGVSLAAQRTESPLARCAAFLFTDPAR
jgi:hypothetical protein